MAVAKKARLIEAQPVGSTTRYLTFKADEELGFTGGQYIIINSGVTLPDGKLAKRAYSILSSDVDQKCFRLAVLKIEPVRREQAQPVIFSGAGSDYMHHLAVGDQIEFSGPWGKFVPQDGPSGGSQTTQTTRTTLVIATDTGLTAALGLVNARRFAPFLRETKILWFVESDYYFLANDYARIPVPVGIGAFQMQKLPAIGLPSRKEQARSIFAALIAESCPSSLFMAGDGDVIFCLREQALSRGLPEDAIAYECFFNNPQRKASTVVM